MQIFVWTNHLVVIKTAHWLKPKVSFDTQMLILNCKSYRESFILASHFLPTSTWKKGYFFLKPRLCSQLNYIYCLMSLDTFWISQILFYDNNKHFCWFDFCQVFVIWLKVICKLTIITNFMPAVPCFYFGSVIYSHL